MGKASQNKKIARAQRAGGGRRSGGPKARSLLFPVTITLVLVLGVGLVVFAKRDREAADEATPPVASVDHWHAAYGVYNCDAFEPAITVTTDPDGIHTHGDGIIHIHPFNSGSSGKNAQLKVFMNSTGLKLTDSEIKLPSGGADLKESDKACGGDGAMIRVAVWKNADKVETEKPTIVTEDFGDIHFTGDRMAMTIFYGPAKAEIPPPVSIPTLDKLSDVGPTSSAPTGSEPVSSAPTGSEPTSSAPNDSSTSTTTGEPSSSAKDTSGSDSTSTTAPVTSTTAPN